MITTKLLRFLLPRALLYNHSFFGALKKALWFGELTFRQRFSLLVRGSIVVASNILFFPCALIMLFLRRRIIVGSDFFQIGDAVYLDIALRRNELSSRKFRYIFFYYPPLHDNPYLLSLYRDKLFFVENSFSIMALSLVGNCSLIQENILAFDVNQCDGVGPQVFFNKYDDKFGENLIEMPEPDISNCLSAFEGFLSRDDKFVVIHARESGYKNNLYNDMERTSRNSDIHSYGLLIEKLVKEGYKVVRAGDNSMSSAALFSDLYPNQFLDYAHCDFRSSMIDIFLFSQADFSVVCASGPSEIGPIFGKNILMINGHNAQCSLKFRLGDVCIFKKLKDQCSGQLVKLDAYFNPPFDGPVRLAELQNLGYVLEDNDADDILMALEDFLSIHRGHCLDTDLMKEFTITSKHQSYGTRAIYSPSFLRKYNFS